MLIFSIMDGKIHLVSFTRPMGRYGIINLANNGLILSESGLSYGSNYLVDAYYVGQDGQINTCFFLDSSDEDALMKKVDKELKDLGYDINVEDFLNLEEDGVDWKKL